jgi:predicted  nucleic acid-binding Zn-ribbon protein
MTQNVTQWLDEIKALKQQLVEMRQEREEAYASAINWQQRYETEAQQRRIEAKLAQKTIETLQQDIQQLKGRMQPDESGSGSTPEIQAAVSDLKTEAELRSRLTQALVECDRLTQALQTEQANHIQTRNSLTTALGDAIATLSKSKE